MQTRYVNTASTAGGDGTTNLTTGATRAFASMNEAEAARPGTLTDDYTYYFEGATADTTATTWSGVTVGSFKQTLTTDAGAAAGRHTGSPYSTSDYRLEVTNAAALTISEAGFTVEWLQVKLIVSSGSSIDAVTCGSASAGCTLRNCVIVADYTNFSRGTAVQSGGGAGTWYILNNIIYDFIDATQSCVGINFTDASGSTIGYLYSNTVYNCRVGITNGGFGVFTLKNNIVNGSTSTDYSVSGVDASATNVSEDATSPNGASYQTTNGTVTFANEAGRNLHLADSDTAAKDRGTDTSGEASPLNFTTDIDGQTRTGTWDIGADEIVPALTQEGFRFRNDDGSESAATWAAAQDADAIVPPGVNRRLRVVLDTAGDAPSNEYRLEYSYNGGPWNVVEK